MRQYAKVIAHGVHLRTKVGHDAREIVDALGENTRMQVLDQHEGKEGLWLKVAVHDRVGWVMASKGDEVYVELEPLTQAQPKPQPRPPAPPPPNARPRIVERDRQIPLHPLWFLLIIGGVVMAALAAVHWWPL